MDLIKLKKSKIKKKLKNGDITVSIFGMGKMGTPLAAVFANHGANVIGVDIDEKVVESINDGENHIEEEPGLDELVQKNIDSNRLRASTDGVKASKKSDLMIILVPTLIDDQGNIKYDPVFDACKKISKGLNKGNIVITEATMPPGTTDKLSNILEENNIDQGDYGLAHAPERTMTGTAIRDITKQYQKIIGANNQETLKSVSGIYEVINEKGIIEMSTIKAAESVKVFEGVYRDVNIGLANELALWSEDNNVNVLEIIDAANSQPYCDIHEPGAGVGGHCIPVYPHFIINSSKDNNPELIKDARKINDSMPKHIVDLTIKGLNSVGKPLKNSNVLVLGLTFRGGVREFMKSPAIPIIKKLNNYDSNVFAYDPICNEEDANRFGAEWKENFKDIDAIIITTDHEEFTDLDLNKIKDEVRCKVLIDGRNLLDKDEAVEIGFEYLRVGSSL